MAHQLNIFLLLFGAIHGALLSLLFLKNIRSRPESIYFIGFLVLVSLQLTFKFITKSWLMDYVLIPYFLSYKLPYLAGPLLYLYVKARKSAQYGKSDLLHFIPFIILAGIDLLSEIIPRFPRLNTHGYLQALLQLVSLTIYGYYALKTGFPALKYFILSVLVSEALIIIALAVLVMHPGQLPHFRWFFLTLTFLIYWISYKVVSTPDFFTNGNHLKYSHSRMKSEEANHIEKLLLHSMQKDKLFLDADLSIDSLAARLGISRHSLSQFINEGLHKSYVDFINELRLEEVKKRLGNSENPQYTITAIALDSGFGSVSSFNEIFKRKYGITPSRYRAEIKNEMTS